LSFLELRSIHLHSLSLDGEGDDDDDDIPHPVFHKRKSYCLELNDAE